MENSSLDVILDEINNKYEDMLDDLNSKREKLNMINGRLDEIDNLNRSKKRAINKINKEKRKKLNTSIISSLLLLLLTVTTTTNGGVNPFFYSSLAILIPAIIEYKLFLNRTNYERIFLSNHDFEKLNIEYQDKLLLKKNITKKIDNLALDIHDYEKSINKSKNEIATYDNIDSYNIDLINEFDSKLKEKHARYVYILNKY